MPKSNMRRGPAVAGAVAGLLLLTSCGGGSGDGDGTGARPHGAAKKPSASPTSGLDRIPDLGDRIRARIPADSRQVVVVYGAAKDSADATVVLYDRETGPAGGKDTGRSGTWDRVAGWPAHNGAKGWTPDHREDDRRSPAGVFTLSDAGGVLADPGARLPYTRSASFAAPRDWARTHWHDFDYVVAIDYNRVKGTPPNDPTRPQGRRKGGGIWLHMDHGSGTSGCVSVSKAAMETLLRSLDPARKPVVVMGDRAYLRS
ncbi:L,D-transpeptidase family protein [Streptomyces sp. NPDC004111]|uniref:L,D-transpeptidase family protein n=1 Tax=Streptomyces sp. NPDC004111 TaxID=3364690 RepID=UPI0036AF093D